MNSLRFLPFLFVLVFLFSCNTPPIRDYYTMDLTDADIPVMLNSADPKGRSFDAVIGTSEDRTSYSSGDTTVTIVDTRRVAFSLSDQLLSRIRRSDLAVFIDRVFFSYTSDLFVYSGFENTQMGFNAKISSEER